MINIMLIPNDIVVEILLRLPAMSLLRLRWACKYWFDLISRDSSFVKMHLHHSTSHNEIFSIISPSLLTATSDNFDTNKIFHCYLNYNNITRVGDGSSEVSIDLPFDYSLGCRSEIKGTCNGLILLYQSLNRSLCIWNLCTKEYRVLPDPLNIQRVLESTYYVYNYGFGYDHTSDDYKVIRNTNYYVSGNLELHSDVQIYTLRTNSWRRIGSNSYNLSFFRLRQGMFLNEVLYWIDCSSKHIISFDFRTEKFQHVSTIPNASGTGGVEFSYVRIRGFEGSLCVVLGIIDQAYYGVEIWRMNDCAANNNNESVWTKVLTFPDLQYIEPLRCTRNGDILMLSDRRYLVLYDRKSAKFLCRDICVEGTHYVIEVYTESLVSLNSGTFKSRDE